MRPPVGTVWRRFQTPDIYRRGGCWHYRCRGCCFASGGFSGDSLPVAPVSSPIDTDIETTKTSEIPTATLTPSLTDIPTPTLGMVVIYDLPQFSNQPSPKSCPGCNLTGADMKGGELRDANLTGANLARANLANVNLMDADLTGADLRETNLTGAVLVGANLTEADLSGAELTSTFLKGAILDGVIGADFTGAWEDWGQVMYHLASCSNIRDHLNILPSTVNQSNHKTNL